MADRSDTLSRLDHPSVNPFRFGDLDVDPAHNTLQFPDGRSEKLTAQCMQVLCLLAERRGDLVSRQELIESVWEGNYPVGDRGIANAIWTLRKVLGDDKEAPRYIQTVPRKGYRAIALMTVAALDGSAGSALRAALPASPLPAQPGPESRKPRPRWRPPWWAWAGIALAALLGWFAIDPGSALMLEYSKQQWVAGARRQQIEVAGQRWAYFEAGQGKPLLLLHSFGSRKEHWLPMMAHLSAQRRVIVPDLPGWGESGRDADADYGYGAQTQRLVQFAGALFGQQKADLVGHGMGGGIALRLAAEHPEAVDSLVLLDALGVRYDNDLSRAMRRGENPLEVHDLLSLHRRLSLLFDRPPPLFWPFDAALVKQHRDNLAFERRALSVITDPEAGAFSPIEAAPRVKVPTLVLWCRGDRVVPFSVAHIFAEQIPRARLVWLEGCNHVPMNEQPETTALEIERFLQAPST